MAKSLVHPRRIGRITFPGSAALTTPPHQDYFYIRGTVENLFMLGSIRRLSNDIRRFSRLAWFTSLWVLSTPMRTIKERSGDVAYLLMRHKLNGTLPILVWWLPLGWMALYFRSYTIHKALPNCPQTDCVSLLTIAISPVRMLLILPR